MIKEKLVSPSDQQYLTDYSVPAINKQQRLTTIILRLSEGCVDKFIGCLKETINEYEPHKELYDKLSSRMQQ